MIELLLYFDKTVFIFINQILSNEIFDLLMPAITDWDKTLTGRIISGVIIIGLIWKGGKDGRMIIILLIPTIIISDQLSSTIIKPFFSRPRPCHQVDGIVIVENIRLLVNCGSGFSFPSSHAVNNFAAATIFTVFYKRYWIIFFGFASLIAFSRVYVGVHYPVDVITGAIIGFLCAAIVFFIWLAIKNIFKL